MAADRGRHVGQQPGAGGGDPAAGRISPHLTLAPPQTVAERDLDRAVALVERAAAATVPFLVVLDGAATFLPDSLVAYLVAREGGPGVARETLEPLAASLHLGGLLLSQAASATASVLDATSRAMALADWPAKLAFVTLFSAVNGALLLALQRYRPAPGDATARRRA